MKKEVKTGAMTIGEKIEFDRVLKTNVDTKFGLATNLKFIKNSEIVRSVFAGKGLLDFLEQIKGIDSVTLVDKISEGEYTYNIFE
jgi:hypothetical protein